MAHRYVQGPERGPGAAIVAVLAMVSSKAPAAYMVSATHVTVVTTDDLPYAFCDGERQKTREEAGRPGRADRAERSSVDLVRPWADGQGRSRKSRSSRPVAAGRDPRNCGRNRRGTSNRRPTTILHVLTIWRAFHTPPLPSSSQVPAPRNGTRGATCGAVQLFRPPVPYPRRVGQRPQSNRVRCNRMAAPSATR